MTSRERVLATCRFEEPDRVPIDLAGSTGASGIHMQAYDRLRQHLGLSSGTVTCNDVMQMLAVVDADVDIRDPVHMEWVMSSRFNPGKDTMIITGTAMPVNIDPASADAAEGSKLVIDATEPAGVAHYSLPDEAFLNRALAVWRELDLPAIEIPKRLRLMLDR